MYTRLNLTMGRRSNSFLFNLMLLSILLLTTGIAHSAVTWVSQANTTFNNDFLSMSSDGSVLAFTTSSTVYGGSGSGNAVIKRSTFAPAAVPGFTFFGTAYPWLTPSGGFVGFFGLLDTTFDAGIYKLIPGAASATSVDLAKDTVISAVLSDSGTLGAYLTDPDNLYNKMGSGTVYYGTTNLGSATSRISASADVSKIAYRNSNTILWVCT